MSARPDPEMNTVQGTFSFELLYLKLYEFFCTLARNAHVKKHLQFSFIEKCQIIT